MPSNVVDDRIVKVEFDNEGFEDGVSDSLNSLNKFEKGLDGLEKNKFGEGLTDSLSDVQNAIDDTNFSPLSDALDSVGSGFSALETIAVGALLRIGSEVADLGMKMVSSLTVDPITEGFQKYTSSSKDVKAIMNQTGKGIDEVSERLNALSWYSDATSYNYSAMVSALKSFSAQNIDIDKAIPMIMGLGNSLSYAGLAAEDASAGFDIYAKAIGRGYMDLRQWQRLNTMGASTADLKQKFLDAAVEEKELTKISDDLYRTRQGLDVSISSFDSSLGNIKGKWLTTKVMTKVLSETYGSYTSALYDFSTAEENAGISITELMDRFDALNGSVNEYSKTTFLAAQEARTFGEAVNAVADAASSAWRAIFENVFGNAIESTELWSDFSELVYNMFMPPLEGLANLTTAWKEFGGRTEFVQGLYNLVGSLSTITGPMTEAFGEVFDIFGEDAAKKLVELSTRFKDWAWNLQLSEEAQKKVHDVALALSKVLKGLSDIVGTLIRFAFDIVKALSPIASIAGEIVYSIFRIGSAIASIFTGTDIAPTINGISDLIGKFGEIIGKAANYINKHLGSATDTIVRFIEIFRKAITGGFSSDISEAASGLLEFVSSFTSAGAAIVEGFSLGFTQKIASFIQSVKAFATSILTTIKDILGIHSPAEEPRKLGVFTVEGFANGIKQAIKLVIGAITTVTTAVIEGITESLDGVTNAVSILVHGVASFIANTAGVVLDAVGQLISGAVGHVAKFARVVIASGVYLVTKLSEGIASASEEVIKAVSKVLVRALNALGEHGAEVVNAGRQLILAWTKGIGEEQPTVAGKIASILTDVLNGFSEIILGVAKPVSEFIATIVNGIAEGTPKVLGAIGNLLHQIAEFLRGDAKADLLSIIDTAGELILAYALAKLPLFFSKIGAGLTHIIGEKKGGLLSGLFGKKEWSGLAGIADNAGGVLNALAKGITNLTKSSKPDTLKAFGHALLEIAAAAFIISKIDPETIPQVLEGMAAGIVSITSFFAGSALVTRNANEKQAAAMKKTMESLAHSFVTVSMGLVVFAAAAKLMGDNEAGITAGLAVLDKMKVTIGELAALGGLGAVLSANTGAGNDGTSSFSDSIDALATAFKKISGALVVFAIAAKIMENADINNAEVVLMELGTIVGLLSIADFKGVDSEGVDQLAKSFLKLSGSLVIFSLAAMLLKSGDLGKTAIALLELSAAIGALTVLSSNFDAAGADTLSMAMIKMSLALLVFAKAALLLNTVDWSSLGKMAAILGGLIGTLVIFSAISSFLLPGVVAMQAFAGAIKTLAKGFLIGAVAMFLFVEALSVLSVMGTASITAALAAIDLLLIGIVGLSGSIENLIVMLIEVVCKAIVESVGTIGNAFKAVILKLIEILDELIPVLSVHLFKWLTLILHDLITFIGNTVATIFETLDKLINEYWPRLMNTLSMVWETFLTTVFGALALFFESFLQAILNFVYDIAKFIRGLGDAIHEVFLAIDYLINDILLPDLLGLVQNTISTLAEEGRKAIGETFETIIGALIGLVVDIALAIPKRLKEGWDQLKEAWKNGFKGSVESDTDKMGEDAVDKLKTGITNNSWKLDSAAKTLWDRIKGTFNKEAGIHSPSIEMAKIGEYLTQGLGIGIEDGEETPIDAMKNLAAGVLNPDLFDAKNLGVGVGADFMSSLSTEDLTLVPGMDLDNVFEGKEDILETFDSIAIPDTTVTSYADNSLVTGAGMDEIAGAFADLNASSDVVVKTGMDNSYVEGEGIGGVKSAIKSLNESSDVDVVPDMELSKIETGIEKIKAMFRELNNSNDITLSPDVKTSTSSASRSVERSVSKAYTSSASSMKELEESAEAVREASKDIEIDDRKWEKVIKEGLEYWIPIKWEQVSDDYVPGGEEYTGKWERVADELDSDVSGLSSILDGGSGVSSVEKAVEAANAVQDAAKEAPAGTAISFVQNNYSPKSLSAIDIYRDTKNALSAVQGGV